MKRFVIITIMAVMLVLTASCACQKACKRLRDLNCPEGQTTDGVTCEEFCRETERQGHDLNLQCLENIQSCSDVSEKCKQ